MSEENQEKESLELTGEEKYQKFVDSWLFPDRKENTEEETKAHELMDIWYREWRASGAKWSGGKYTSFKISVPEGQEVLLQAWKRRKQEDPQPIIDERRDYLEQQEKERARKLEQARRKQQAELASQRSQTPLMNKDEIGLKCFELQVEALKCFIQYVKDIQYCLPLHIPVKPYIDIAKHLRRTIGLLFLTKSMDENWIKKYGIEIDSVQNELKLIDKYVKIRRKQMIFI